MQEACARTCGECCYDSPDFTFVVRGENKSCLWIKKQPNRVKQYCGVEDGNGLLVQDHCPDTCGICRDKTNNTPTRVPVTSSACANDINWTSIGNGIIRPRSHASGSATKKDGVRSSVKQDVEDACPQACGVCCENDVDYSFDVNAVSRDCAWVSSTIDLQTTYCGTFENGKMVPDACPDRCLSTVIPAPAPTPSSSTPATTSPTADLCLNDDTWNWVFL